MSEKKKKLSAAEIKAHRLSILNRLNQDDEGWLEECQDCSDAAMEVVLDVIQKLGFNEEDEEWETLADKLSVSWVPGHYE
jgi:hypothetical protein